jgi:hypothetical protein
MNFIGCRRTQPSLTTGERESSTRKRPDSRWRERERAVSTANAGERQQTSKRAHVLGMTIPDAFNPGPSCGVVRRTLRATEVSHLRPLPPLRNMAAPGNGERQALLDTNTSKDARTAISAEGKAKDELLDSHGG